MLSNQWLTEIALRRVVTRRKTGNSRATDFRVEKQYVNPVTSVTPKNNTGGNRFAVSREQKFEFVHCSSCQHAIPATPRDQPEAAEGAIMSGYLDRLKKNSALIGTDKTAKTDKSLCTPPFVSFGSEPPSENANFSEARCCECRHGKPATANDPYSWHSCRAGNPGWWGMAARRCEIQLSPRAPGYQKYCVRCWRWIRLAQGVNGKRLVVEAIPANSSPIFNALRRKLEEPKERNAMRINKLPGPCLCHTEGTQRLGFPLFTTCYISVKRTFKCFNLLVF